MCFCPEQLFSAIPESYLAEHRCLHGREARASATARSFTRARSSRNSCSLKFSLIEWNDSVEPLQRYSTVLHLPTARVTNLFGRTIWPTLEATLLVTKPCDQMLQRRQPTQKPKQVRKSFADHAVPRVPTTWAPEARKKKFIDSAWKKRVDAFPFDEPDTVVGVFRLLRDLSFIPLIGAYATYTAAGCPESDVRRCEHE